MADPPGNLDSDPPRNNVVPPGVGPGAGIPRWVKMFLIAGSVLVLLFVVAMVTGLFGEHGPGQHADGGNAPSSTVEGSVGKTPTLHHTA